MMKIDDNLELAPARAVVCVHCGAELGPDPQHPMAKALVRERKSRRGEPGIHADPELFTERPIVFRQRFCPGCFTLLLTEVVPGDEPEYRHWQLSAV